MPPVAATSVPPGALTAAMPIIRKRLCIQHQPGSRSTWKRARSPNLPRAWVSVRPPVRRTTTAACWARKHRTRVRGRPRCPRPAQRGPGSAAPPHAHRRFQRRAPAGGGPGRSRPRARECSYAPLLAEGVAGPVQARLTVPTGNESKAAACASSRPSMSRSTMTARCSGPSRPRTSRMSAACCSTSAREGSWSTVSAAVLRTERFARRTEDRDRGLLGGIGTVGESDRPTDPGRVRGEAGEQFAHRHGVAALGPPYQR